MFRSLIRRHNHTILFQKRSVSYFNRNHDFIWSDNDINNLNKDIINTISFGFTKYGIEQLGDIVYAESFKNIDDIIDSDESIGVVESVKASVDITPCINGVINSKNDEFFQLIDEIGGVTMDDITQLDSFDESNGIILYTITLQENTKEHTIQHIMENYMNLTDYNDYIERN